MPIGPDAQAAVCSYLESAISAYSTSYNIRNQMLQRDLAYYRTNDATSQQNLAKNANAQGDPKKIQNIIMPVVMPQVESRLASLQEIFLSGHPIFASVAPPTQQNAIKQMDALIEDNSVRGKWPNELLLTMRDGLKYDLGAIEVVWENRKLFTIGTPQSTDLSEGVPVESYYKGNFLKRLNPYNLLLDTRVSPEVNHEKGEFAGYTDVISRIQLKKEMEDLNPLGCMNFRAAFESPGPATANSTDINAPYFIPSVNPDALLPTENRREHDWMAWVQATPKEAGINYKNAYERTILYCRILPSDFKITTRNRNHVQIWKFIIINRSVVIFAERQTNAHNFLPIVCCKPSNDGLEWQSKSFAENAMPFQAVASALVNSALESQRRKVYDRLLYDPSKINKRDIDDVSPVARIPVKNSHYGKALGEAVYQLPYRDEGAADIMAMAQQYIQQGDIAQGQNRVQQGQFQKGNKTRREFETVMSNASNRERMMALGLEFTFFMPIKEIIKTNILQYQPPSTLVNRDSGESVEINPQTLREAALEFKLADGFLPSDKIISPDVVSAMFNAAAADPQIRVEYDLMGMFLYSLKLQGGSWVTDFKRTPEQQQLVMAQMQQTAGMRSGSPPAPSPSQS
jgi:hypothetical protein